MSASKSPNKWLSGEVIWFDEYSGEGQVRCEDGLDFFVHYSAIQSKKKWKSLKPDEEVKFKVSQDPSRPHVTSLKEV